MPETPNTAADKILQTLLAFERQPAWQLGPLSAELDLPKSTVHRLLGKLREYDLVAQDASGTYRLGLGAWRLALGARPYEPVRRAARPVLEHLAETTGESAFLTVADGLHSLCLDRVEGPQRLRFSLEIGALAPLDRGASNVILLAHLAPHAQQQALAHWLADDAAGRKRLARELERIRRQGYVYTNAQYTPGVAALAVPVPLGRTPLVAGMSVGGFAERFTEEVALAQLPALQAAAAELAAQLEPRTSQNTSQNTAPKNTEEAPG